MAVTCNGKTTVSEPWSVTIAYEDDSASISPVALNGSVTFKVSTSGPVTGLQWLKNGIPVPGATGNSFTLSHITQADSHYSCRVSSPSGDQTTQLHFIVIVTDRPKLSPIQMPAAQTGRAYFFDIPLDPTPEHMAAKVAITGLPSGLRFSYYPTISICQIYGAADTSNRASSSYPLTITATNPLGSVTVHATLNLIPPSPSFAGVYTAIVKPSPEVAPQGGRIDVLVSETGMATGRLWLGQRTYSLVMAGYYIDSNYIPGAQYIITPTPHDALSFETYLPEENGARRRLFFAVDGTFLGVHSSDYPLCGLELWPSWGTVGEMKSTTLKGWAKTRSALSPTGKYNFTMRGTVSSPGRGSLSYGSNGFGSVAARLPDGTAFTTSSWMSDGFDWMIYAPLYGGKGYVSGSGKIAGPVTGEASWLHPAPTKPGAGDFGLFKLGVSDP